jgi:hypothetical protein
VQGVIIKLSSVGFKADLEGAALEMEDANLKVCSAPWLGLRLACLIDLHQMGTNQLARVGKHVPPAGPLPSGEARPPGAGGPAPRGAGLSHVCGQHAGAAGPWRAASDNARVWPSRRAVLAVQSQPPAVPGGA